MVASTPLYLPSFSLTLQAPEASAALFQTLYFLQPLLPQGLCPGRSHHLRHSSLLIHSPPARPHMLASVHVLRQPLTSLMGQSPYHLLSWCLWFPTTCSGYCICIWVILLFLSTPSSGLSASGEQKEHCSYSLFDTQSLAHGRHSRNA